MAYTNAGGKFYIAVTTSGGTVPAPQPDDLTQSEYEALNWIQVKNVGALPESGKSTNVVSYDTIDTEVTQKAHGISNAGDGTLELARVANDPGQIALRAAAATKFNFAFKRELTDAPTAGHTNTIFYNRGIISGPLHSGGRNEDFVLETYQLGYNQLEIVVDPETI